MTNFFVLIDPVAERREKFIRTITPLIPPVSGLITDSCSHGDFHAVWAAHSQSPISCRAVNGSVAIVWGDAIAPGETTRITASNLHNYWQKSPQSPAIFDGFHVALTYIPKADSYTDSQPDYVNSANNDFLLGLMVSADLLGLFPVYYYIHEDIALIASSPELFRHHPCCQLKFNPKGLVGILLTNGSFNGHTLWQEVRRLKSGHCLQWQPGNSPQEIYQYQLPTVDEDNPYQDISLNDHLDILDQLLTKTLDRHLQPHHTYNLMLSGGLDSRVLAGFMDRRGLSPRTLTLGDRQDIEMNCAESVAKYLGLEHDITPTKLSEFLNYAQLYNQWEHLINGGSAIAFGWGIVEPLRKLAPNFLTGLCLEVASCGPLPVIQPGEEYSFDLLFQRRVNPWGFSPELLQKLLKKEAFGDLVPEVMAEIYQVYQSYSDSEYTRYLSFEFYHRERFHVGSRAWIFNFGATPVIPILDQELLTTTTLLPMRGKFRYNYRLVQQQLVMTRFPELAKLPLDRNDFNIQPLLLDKPRRVRTKFYELQKEWYKFQQSIGYDRRYYYHILNTSNSGWQAIRREAEKGRSSMADFFYPEIFNELLPPTGAQLKFNRDAGIESSGAKLLIAFMLWANSNL